MRNTGPGRPREVDSPHRCSIVFGRKQMRILAKAEQNQLAKTDSASRSRIVRQMVDLAWAEHKDDLQEIWRLEMANQELQRRLDQAEKARIRAEKAEQDARNKVRGKESAMQGLLRHLPDVRARAASGLALPSGVPLLDQVWYNAGRSWSRVLARLEEVQRQRDGPPPPAPPPPLNPPGGNP